MYVGFHLISEVKFHLCGSLVTSFKHNIDLFGLAFESRVKYICIKPHYIFLTRRISAPSKATTLHMNIEKGMRDGDSITFETMGEQRPKQIPGDVVFKLKLQKHKVFTRRGNDLTIKDKITLRQALLGFEKKIKHLDGHEVSGLLHCRSPVSGRLPFSGKYFYHRDC